jgi:uncharacterized protein with GYD domain
MCHRAALMILQDYGDVACVAPHLTESADATAEIETDSARKGNAMATYVTLYNFTDQGLKGVKDTVKRTEAAKKAASQMGVTIKDVLWVQGQYDVIVIAESSDEIASSALGLSTLKLGNVRGQTLRAFTAAEMEKILEKVA